MSSLEGKVALITGAAGGTGAAHAEVFAAAGAKVVLADIADDSGRAGADKLGAGAARYTHLDVTSTEGWAEAVALAVDSFGKLDILVNNAGICPVASLDGTSAELMSQVLGVNTIGPLLGMQAAARVMDRGSVIINIASIDGLRGVAGPRRH